MQYYLQLYDFRYAASYDGPYLYVNDHYDVAAIFKQLRDNSFQNDC